MNNWTQFFFTDYQQNYQLLHARRGRGRILPATPNKPSILQIPDTDSKFHELNRSPTRVSNKRDYIIKFSIIYFHDFFSGFQYYNRRNQSIDTPHSVHAFPHSMSTTFYNQNRRESFDNEINRPPFRDKERELYERQVEFERELEKERSVRLLLIFSRKNNLKMCMIVFFQVGCRSDAINSNVI